LQAEAARCNGTRRDGAPCAAAVVLPSGFCRAHDPAGQAAVQAGRQAGGRARSTASRSFKHLPPALADVARVLGDLVDEVRSGKLEPQRAAAIASLAGKLLDYSRDAGELGEQRELAERLARLESVVHLGPPRRAY
jgi:hypothetical protein